MPPKSAKAKAAPVRTDRYKHVLQELRETKARAKQTLKEIRKRKRAEDQRHRRLIKKASRLDAQELMEIAGLNKITLGELSQHAATMGVNFGAHEEEHADNEEPEPPMSAGVDENASAPAHDI